MDEITPVAPPELQQPIPTPPLPFRRPADYYSSAVTEVKPLFPVWVPYGCGGAAIVTLVLVFAMGYALSHGAMGALLDLMFGSIQGEVDKMFTPDVKPAEKAEFDQEMKTLRVSVRENRINMERLQPLMRTIHEVSMDEKVNSAETKRLTNEIREINKVQPVPHR